MPHEQQSRRVPLADRFGRQVRSSGETRAAVLSAALHVAVIGLLIWGGSSKFIDATRGPGADLGRGGGGGGGGGGVRAFAIFTPAGAEAQTPPPPEAETPALVVPETPTVIPETPPQQVAPAAVAPPTAPAGEGTGPGAGTGTGPGTGIGTGGGSGSGTGSGTGSDSGAGGGGGTVFPPQLQGMIMPPPNRPGNLRGVRLAITFQVNEKGEVMNVVVDPPIRDRGFRNDFMDRLRRYRFVPAYTRDGGRAVAAEVVIYFTL